MVTRPYYMKKNSQINQPGKPSSSIDFADRWLADGIDVCEAPAGIGMLEVDMSMYEGLLEQDGKKITLAAVLVRVAAVALSRHPQLKKLCIGNRRYFPDHVDIGLSIAGETFVSPLMLLKDVDTKDVEILQREIESRAAAVRQKDETMLNFLRRWGWLVPLGGLRRMIIKSLMSQFWFRKEAGLLQVSHVPGVDVCAPLKFNASALLGFGPIKKRIIAVQDAAVVRPTLILSCMANHKVWDGMCIARFLGEIKDILECGHLGEILLASADQTTGAAERI